MASRADKENPAPPCLRSKIPVSTAIPALTKNHGMDRHPLGNIQASTAGGMTQEGRKRLKTSAVIQTIFREISPRGSVYELSKFTSSLDKNENRRKVLQAFADRTKHVTIRKKEVSPLDWDFEELRAGEKHHKITKTTYTYLAAGFPRRSRSADRVGETAAKPWTPKQVPVAQHNRVKNIKRSLKRPSSRELQTRTACEEVQTQAPAVLPQERTLRVKCDLGSVDTPIYTRELTLMYERHIMKYLLQSSQELKAKPRLCSVQRSIVVNWLVKVNSVQGSDACSPQVLQAAVRHLDRVLTLDAVPIERVQLLAAACFWLAQKQCAKPRSASCFARHAADAFCGVDLKAAEKYVLRRLNFPRIPIVADDFVPYLVLVCCPKNPVLLTTGATFLCTAALLDMDLSSCSPDLIALAAVINCMLLLREGKIECLHRCPIYQSTGSNPRLREVRSQLLRTVLVMKDQLCPCREAYAQYDRPPLYVAKRLANRALDVISSTPITV